MWRKDLFIDTRFSEIDSTDIKQNEEEFQLNNYNNEEYKKQQAMINFMMLDFYYRGNGILDNLFQSKNQQEKKYAYEVLKSLENRRTNHLTGAFRKKQIQGNNHYRKRQIEQQNNVRGREYSDSVDRMNLLNNIADRILETKRIKSESKISSGANITVKEGKKILSKLDKLEKMIKGIRKQNQLSNQASVVYINRSRHPEEFISDERYNRKMRTQIDHERRYPIHTPHRSDYPVYSHHPPPVYVSPRQRLYQQPSIQMQPRYRYPSPNPTQVHNYQDYDSLYRPAYIHNYRQDESIVHQGNISQRLRNFPIKQQFDQDRFQEEESESISEKQKNDVNLEIMNIKDQLNELRKMNMDYLTKNSLILEQQAKNMKEKRYTYQNQLPQRQIRNEKRPFVRKESLPKSQQITSKHPLVPALDLARKNDAEFTRRNLFEEQQIQQPKFYTQRSRHPYQSRDLEYGNYPIPEYQTERGPNIEQYITPMNHKHEFRQGPGNMCGLCGCFCHEHDKHNHRGHQGF